MYAEMFPQFIEMGAVEDLTPYLEKSGTSDNYLYLDDAKMMGGIYGLPIEAANPGVLYYKKESVKKQQKILMEMEKSTSGVLHKVGVLKYLEA